MSRRSSLLATVVIMVLLIGLSGCGYNDLQGLDEDTKAAWSEVVNQYQRRADLIPNLVATVKGYAAHEKETLEGVVQARAQATGIQVTPETLKDPAAFEQFGIGPSHCHCGELSQSESRPELP
jgi:LemA protein